MKQKILISAAWLFLLLLILFVVLKPKTPDFGSIAVVTQNDNAILPLPELGDNVVRYRLEPDSFMTWTGRKIGWFHDGTVDISLGAIVIDDDANAAAKFIIDMNSIVITDMSQDNPMYNQLLNHLRDGFFDVRSYPTVVFDLKKAIKKSSIMYDMIGDLKIKWVTREITFPAQVEFVDQSLFVRANFFIDRTQWWIDEVIQIADKYIELGIDFAFEML
jgi:polyisoprenoid-binding protein YceI